MLRGLADGPNSLAELQGRGGSPGSTLRARLKDLVDAEVIAARRNRELSGSSLEYELTVAGEELLGVIETLERWLSMSPCSSHPLGSEGAKAAIGALAEGWSAALLRALAAKPHSIADLDSLIANLNYPSLERRIAAMRLAGQVEARSSGGRETPYAVTAWLRQGIAPLLAAIRWERLYLAEACTPPTVIDVEAVFLLIMPLLRMEERLSGRCRLAVELPQGYEPRLAGVVSEFRDGRLTSCTTRLDGAVDAWASGPVAAWLAALLDDDPASLELGGDGRLARDVVTGLHRALFGARTQKTDELSLLAD